MTDVICACCGTSSYWSNLHRLPKFIFGVSAKIYKCGVCGCGYTHPMPNLTEQFYSDNQRYLNLFTEQRELYVKYAKQLLEVLNPYDIKAGAKLLDVASGSGALVEAAKELGFVAMGIESNCYMVDVCRENDLKIYNVTVENINSVITQQQDVVVFSAILEHLPDPLEALKSVSEILTTDGYVVISQADYTGFLPSFAPWFWYGWQPQEHYWHFSVQSMAMLACRAGYKVIGVRKKKLNHPWCFERNIKRFVGKNIAAAISALTKNVDKYDSFELVLKKVAHSQ